MPVAKISFSFQLSGCGDGFTLSFAIVMIVPNIITQKKVRKKISTIKCSDSWNPLNLHCKPTIIQNGNDQNHER